MSGSTPASGAGEVNNEGYVRDGVEDEYESSLERRAERQRKCRRYAFYGLAGAFVLAFIIVLAVTLSRRKVRDPNVWAPVLSDSVLGVYENAAVASDGITCSKVGSDFLKAGGSAVDAMIALALCNGFNNIHSMGIGGGFIMTYYNATTKEGHVIDARDCAPLKATSHMIVNDTNHWAGPLSIAVPGELQGYWEAHQRWGRLPWASLFEPAIRMAEEGWKFSRESAHWVRYVMPVIKISNSNLGDLLYKKKEKRWMDTGDVVKNPKLAQVLRAVARDGPNALYNGEFTDRAVSEIKGRGGILVRQDFENYRAVERKPAVYTMRNGWKIYGSPPPTSAAVVEFIINIMEGYPINESTPLDEEALLLHFHRFVESSKFAFGKRSLFGDPKFVNVNSIVKDLVSHGFAESIRKQITDRPHAPWVYGHSEAVPLTGTSHSSLLAPNGDAVAFTSSVNGYFGTKIIGENTGIIYNNNMQDFAIPGKPDMHALPPAPTNLIEPGKRMMSSMCPIIVTDDKGKVRVVIGASGGAKIITSVASVLINHLFFKQNIKEAIDMPRLHNQLFPDSTEFEATAPEPVVQDFHEEFHQPIKKSREWRIGIVQAITVDDNGVINANCDYRKGSAPAGF